MNTDRDPASLRPRKPRPYWPVIVVALLVPVVVVLSIDDLRLGLVAQISRLWSARSLPARPAEQRRPEAASAASTAIPPDPNANIERAPPGGAGRARLLLSEGDRVPGGRRPQRPRLL